MDHNFLENDSPEEELEEDKLVKLEMVIYICTKKCIFFFELKALRLNILKSDNFQYKIVLLSHCIILKIVGFQIHIIKILLKFGPACLSVSSFQKKRHSRGGK